MQSIDQEGKTVEEALEKALLSLNKTESDVEYEVLDEGSKGVLGVGARPLLIRVRVKETEDVLKAKALLVTFFEQLEVPVNAFDVYEDKNDTIKIEIDLEDPAILIGKHGQTLDSIQYLVNQIMHETKYKYSVDISKYKDKQNQKLIDTVKKIAERVVQTKRKIILKPMSAFDRRLVHEAVKDFPELVTKSIGVDPRRRVVISMSYQPEVQEEDFPEEMQERGGYDRDNRGYNPNRRSYGGGNYQQGGYRQSNDRYGNRPNNGGGRYNPGYNNNSGEGRYNPAERQGSGENRYNSADRQGPGENRYNSGERQNTGENRYNPGNRYNNSGYNNNSGSRYNNSGYNNNSGSRYNNSGYNNNSGEGRYNPAERQGSGEGRYNSGDRQNTGEGRYNSGYNSRYNNSGRNPNSNYSGQRRPGYNPNYDRSRTYSPSPEKLEEGSGEA
jgi:spoIIIJ-associated protein